MKTKVALFFAVALWLAGFTPLVAASAPSVEAHLAATQIFEGENVVYEVQVGNVKDGIKPDLSEFNTDFDVAEMGQRSVRSSSFTIIMNGEDVSPQSNVTYAYRYQLTPKHSGSLTVPAPFISVDGRKITGRPLALLVTAVEKQDLVMMEIDASKARVFPYQEFEISVKIWVKPLPNSDADPLQPLEAPRFQMNWMDPPAGLKASDDLNRWLEQYVRHSAKGFLISYKEQYGVLSPTPQRAKHKALDGQERLYFLYEMKRKFSAQRAGAFQFGPATLKGIFANGISGGNYTGQAVFVTAPALTVVATLPDPRPANFNGAYGQFNLHATASAKDLRVGDPVVLTLSFERSPTAGLLEELTAPDLTANLKLAEDFTIVDKSPPGQTAGNSKSFAYTLRPKKAGVSIPPVVLTVFNTQSEKFEETAFNAIALNVTDAPELRADAVISNAQSGGGQNLRANEKGVFQNIVDPAEISVPALNPLLYMGTMAVLWLSYALGFLLWTVRQKRAGDAALQRRMRAQAEAGLQIASARSALKDNNASAAALSVHRALMGLIGIWNGVPPEGMTAHDAAALLERAGASSTSRDHAVSLLNSIEGAKYGSIAGLQGQALVTDAESLIPVLQKEMSAKK